MDEALKVINKSPELNYMTQIVFMLFEDTSKPRDSKDRFNVEIRFSPGAKSRQVMLEADGIGQLDPLKKVARVTPFVNCVANGSDETMCADTVPDVDSTNSKPSENGVDEQATCHVTNGHIEGCGNGVPSPPTAPGLQLATELASTIQPLISVCSAPLHEVNDFFTSIIDVKLDFEPKQSSGTGNSLPNISPPHCPLNSSSQDQQPPAGEVTVN